MENWIQRTLVSVDHVATESTPKTSSGRRVVDLDAHTLAIIRSWRARQAEDRLRWGSAYRDSGLVFTREDGAPTHPEAMTKAFVRLVARSGLPPIRLHDLRHTHATLALAAGIHPKIVQQRLGHADVALTMNVYSHVLPAMQADAAEQIAGLVFGGKG